MVYALSIGDVIALIGLLQTILKTVLSSDAAKEVQSALNFVECLNIALEIIEAETQGLFQSISSKIRLFLIVRFIQT